MTQPKVDTLMRALYCGVALLAVCYLAIAQQNEIATGAVIAFLSMSGGYLFRSKYVPPAGPTP